MNIPSQGGVIGSSGGGESSQADASDGRVGGARGSSGRRGGGGVGNDSGSGCRGPGRIEGERKLGGGEGGERERRGDAAPLLPRPGAPPRRRRHLRGEASANAARAGHATRQCSVALGGVGRRRRQRRRPRRRSGKRNSPGDAVDGGGLGFGEADEDCQAGGVARGEASG